MSPKILRLLPRRARRLGRRASLHAGKITATPFPRLVRHFLTRMVRDGHSDSAELQLGIGPLLALLAVPGAFQCFLMLDKYSSFLNWFRGRLHQDLLVTSASDKYMFLSIAMAITGIVAVLKWDRILPDSQDYLNLAPLPLRRRDILLANAAAIAIAVTVLAVDVNGASAVLFPMFVTAAAPPGSIALLPFMMAHAVSAILASLFAFCIVFAILGVLAAALPRDTFTALSSWLRGVLLVGFIALLLTGFAGPALIRRLELTPGSPVRLLPPMWYLSLYQNLQHRPLHGLAALAPAGVASLGVAFALMVLSYSLSYRRRFASVLEGGRLPSRQRFLRLALAVLDWFSYREPGFQRASYHFIVRALLRNETQRFWLSVSLALGWLLAFQSASSGLSRAGTPPAASLLGAPLIAAYLLILGLRLSFECPAALPANWIFRSVLDWHRQASLSITRRVMLAFLVPLVLLPCLAFFSWFSGPASAALQTAYVLAVSLCLIEVLLSGYRKIPFTCAMPGFRENLPLQCFVQLLGFLAFVRAGAALERWMLARPAYFLLVPVAMAAAYFWNRGRIEDARVAGELLEGLSFENRISPAVQQLKLLDSD